MRRLFAWLAAGLLVVGAGVASANPLDVSGVVGIQLATLSPVTVPSGGAVTVTVNGSLSAGHLSSLDIAANLFQTAGLVVPITDPAVVNTIGGIQVTAMNGAGAFDGGSTADLTGTMPLNGFAKVCLFGACSASVQNLAVPLDVVGVGGTVYVNASVKITVVGSPWTTGTINVGTVTQMGFAHGPATAASSTADVSGRVRLVSPMFVSTSLASSFPVVPAFAFLDLHFVPEPGTMLLLGSGIAGLVLFGRGRKS